MFAMRDKAAVRNHPYFNTKGGKCEFVAVANLMVTTSGSGPSTGSKIAHPFSAAEACSEQKAEAETALI